MATLSFSETAALADPGDRPIAFTSSSTGYPADRCNTDLGPAHLVMDNISAGAEMSGTATMAGRGSNDFYFELKFVDNSYGVVEDLANVGYQRVQGVYTSVDFSFTAPVAGKLVGCRSAEVDEAGVSGPAGKVTGTVKGDGGPSATPAITVTGTSVALKAVDIAPNTGLISWDVYAEGAAEPVAERDGVEATVDGLAPGRYEVKLSFCTLSPPLHCGFATGTFTITAPVDFEVVEIPGRALSRRLVVSSAAADTSYTWSVNGTPLGESGPSVVWNAPLPGTYEIAMTATKNGAGRTVRRQVTVGYRIDVVDTLANGLMKGLVADPKAPCDGDRTVLTVTSDIGIWATLRTASSAALTNPPVPGGTAELGLLPPNGVATWTGGCFNKAGQSFWVDADIADRRALAATALAGFLSSVSGGRIDVNAMARAMSYWESVSEWPLPNTRAAIDEMVRIAQGKGKLAIAGGYLYAALTLEPEATRLREFLASILGAVPVIGDFAQLAEEVAKAWLGLGADPYKLGDRATKEQMERRQANLQERLPDQEQNVLDATTKKAEKDLRLKEIDDDIKAVRTDLDARKAERLALVCPPKVQQCLLKQRQLDGEIQRLTAKLTNLVEKARPPAFERATKAAAKLLEEEKALAAMTKAIKVLGTVVQLLNQLAMNAELAIRVMQGQRKGTMEFRTGI
ncbi:hypothetical protein AB0J72_17930 [Dactylosporangium sp. NPDC049742]|uniref:hypothetical protein n=1 Tax=Dactylosporangium sp. NPDC049742 TaxID=3154737 RepID=UPI003414B64C